MKFIDTAEIKVKAGDGGLGMSHFRREKYVPAGGPDGGNGGNGGDVYLEATEGLSTLLDFRYQRYYEAETGGKGGTNNRQGKTGETLTLKVPCGTVAYDIESGELIGEVLYEGHRLLVAKGGKGGIGNTLFVNSRNQAPTKTIPPVIGENRNIRLELKMIADVGIIGSPNAGKSTLITVISAARPKVADYPFTTLVPTLGVVSHKEANPFVVADVPGLIPGASQGKGLGHDFLRHIERTCVLIHLIDGSQETAEAMISDYDGILEELALYDGALLQRPRITVISKVDSLAGEEMEENTNSDALNGFKNYLKLKKTPFFEISSAFRIGINELLDKLIEVLSDLKNMGENSK
ncbi:GTPase ObgE [Pigmentibacter sp. JX0631]|uniref:GTPase ObgE n=1 Tax=Pigmentibacter sp. JX0631 TaxID=2976982 RepID=UPI002468BDBB|nr:GTPase ObgE [Pigmentibacter sp. JX0631]WGL58718.1 GTPase ObgE [Pigmentibacter sp. JX0631]